MRRPAFQALDREWAILTRSASGAAAIRRWRGCAQLTAGSLDELVQRIWAAGPAHADRICAALARRARTDALAARTLLQALRPGLRSLGRRLNTLSAGPDVDVELLGLAWERIRTYPIDRRPRHIAANVLLDVRKRHIAGVTCRDRGHESLEVIPQCEHAIAPSAECQALDADLPSLRRAHDRLATAIAAGRITPANAVIVWRSRIQQKPDPDIAGDLGVTVRTMQRRRQRTERRLAAVG